MQGLGLGRFAWDGIKTESGEAVGLGVLEVSRDYVVWKQQQGYQRIRSYASGLVTVCEKSNKKNDAESTNHENYDNQLR
jgi:hypothetical protein